MYICILLLILYCYLLYESTYGLVTTISNGKIENHTININKQQLTSTLN
jgi:hypothetical protein